MGTIVTIDVSAPNVEPPEVLRRQQIIDRAFGWFSSVEERCTRFNPNSELMQLTAQSGQAVPVSDIVYEAVHFALTVAEETNGAFDPTIGHSMAERGFNREYSTGEIVESVGDNETPATYRDVQLDPDRRTITLLRPLVLDLGAVAKGLAIDLAAQELHDLENFSIDAGGDLFLGGCNPNGEPWSIGIRHPRLDGELIDVIYVSDCAVCTSGDYERRISDENQHHLQHHILDPRTGTSANAVASVTVIAPAAILADSVATAVFVLGPAEGIRLMERLELDGLIITPALERYQTSGMKEYYLGGPAIL
jgi:thiamine biosynthesis lipoprotein